MLGPLVEALVDVDFYASEAAERREQRFVGIRTVEEAPEPVGSIDANGTVFELGEIVVAVA